MKVELGKRLSQKTIAMQRCFREGGLIQKMFAELQMSRQAVRHGQPRLASNMLSELRWHTLPPLLESLVAEGEKKSLRRLVKEVKGAEELLRNKANLLKPLDERETDEFRQRLDHMMFRAQQHHGFATDRCGGTPGYR